MKILLVDANALAYQVRYKIDLSYEGAQTGILFGFLHSIFKIAKLVDTNKIFFFWDSPQLLRIKMFPAYKEKRRKARKEKPQAEKLIDDQCYKQFNLLNNSILPDIGFKCYQHEGYEADDLIASAVKNNPFHFVIVSGDEDMYQLLSEKVSMYKTNKKEFYTLADFTNEYHITPSEWPTVKAMSGCTTDEIPGLPNIAEKTAAKYLRRELKQTTQAYANIVSSEGKRVITFNLPLVTLPLKGTPIIKLAIPKEVSYSFSQFVRICDRYGFKSMLEKEYLHKCKELLNLQ
jgi:DNA polymerase-1